MATFSALRSVKTPSMKIERAVEADAPALAKMNKRLIEDERHPNPMTEPELEARMSAFLEEGYAAYVVRQGERIVAYALYRDGGSHFYLRHLYVEHGFRRRGIATELLDWLYANVWPGKPVRLDVLAHNSGAIAFYEAYGFRVSCLGMQKPA
jgi:ribosomal protein S18 acetylase RimI-like enzyme